MDKLTLHCRYEETDMIEFNDNSQFEPALFVTLMVDEVLTDVKLERPDAKAIQKWLKQWLKEN